MSHENADLASVVLATWKNEQGRELEIWHRELARAGMIVETFEWDAMYDQPARIVWRRGPTLFWATARHHTHQFKVEVVGTTGWFDINWGLTIAAAVDRLAALK